MPTEDLRYTAEHEWIAVVGEGGDVRPRLGEGLCVGEKHVPSFRLGNRPCAGDRSQSSCGANAVDERGRDSAMGRIRLRQ